MGRRARMRTKLREEELEELEERLDKTEPGPAAEEKAEQEKEAEEKTAAAPEAADGPAARVLELQKTAGNRAVGAALARWQLPLVAQQLVAQWPKQMEMIIDGKTVIPIESAQLGNQRHLTNPAGTGGNRETVDESGEIVVTLKQGEWSTDLARESLHGRGYKTVEIVFPGKDGKGFRIILSEVLISSYSISGHGDDAPTESITLNFKKRELSQDPPPRR